MEKKINLTYIVLSLLVYAAHYLLTLSFAYNNLVDGTDTYFYFMLSKDFANGRFSFPFMCLPGYPLFLSVFAKAFHNFAFFIFIQHLLFWSAGVLLFKSVSILRSPKAGILAGIIYLFYTPFLAYASALVPEGLGVFLFSLALYSWSRLWSERITEPLPRLEAAILGVVSGFLCVARPVFLPWVFAVGAYFAIKAKVKPRIGFVLIYFIGLLSVLFVVAYPNYKKTGRLMLSAHTGVNFYIGNNEKATGLFTGLNIFRGSQEGLLRDSVLIARQRLHRPVSEAEADEYWYGQALLFIANHPIKFLKLLLFKLWFLLSSKEFYEAQGLLFWPSIPFGFIIPFAFLGLWTSRKEDAIGVLRLAFVLVMLVNLLGFINVRYKLMFAFPAIGLFAIGVSDLWLAFAKNKRSAYIMGLFSIPIFILSLFIVPPARLSQQCAGQYNKAISWLDANEPEMARDLLLKMLQKDSGNWAYWHALGQSYYMLKDYEKAIAAYNKALALNPVFLDAAYNLAICYNKSGRYGISLKTIGKILEFDPDNVDALFIMVEDLVKLNKCDEARDLAGRLLNLLKGQGPKNQVKEVLNGCSADG